jgi:hydroxyacylglutathione hydrolase
MLLFKFTYGPLHTNAYLIGCPETKKGAVIDPSMGSTSAVIEKAASLGLHLEKFLLTHSHWDQIVDVHELKEKTKAALYVHPLDVQNVIAPGSDGLPLMVSIQPVTPDHFLNEGESVSVGHLKIEVIHTPGHSPGCVCLYLPKEKVLFSGDTLFKGTIGRLNLPTGEETKMWTSLAKLAKLPLETKVYPGHGPETTIGHESWLSRARDKFLG